MKAFFMDRFITSSVLIPLFRGWQPPADWVSVAHLSIHQTNLMCDVIGILLHPKRRYIMFLGKNSLALSCIPKRHGIE